MKKKILIIVLAVILALSVSALVACSVKVKSISLKSDTFVTEYIVGDTVSYANAKISVVFTDDTEKTVDLTESMLDKAIDTSKAGKTTYTITYENVKTTFEVTVREVASIELKANSFPANVLKGETVLLTNAKLVVKFTDNTSKEIPVTQDMLDKAIATSEVGTTEYTVTFKSKTVKFSIEVRDIPVSSIEIAEGDFVTNYYVGDEIDWANSKLTVNFEGNEPSRKIALTADMFTPEINLSAPNTTEYTVTYGEGTAAKTTTVTITVERKIEKFAYEVESFELPLIDEYNDRANKPDENDSDFKVQGQVYEVGNANKFIVEPSITYFNENDERNTLSEGVKTSVKVEVSETKDGTYNELTGEELEGFVTVENNAYLFAAEAADRYVKLTVKLDSEIYDLADESVTTERSVTFKVVANGYNVYNQMGLAVMTDYIRPEFWSEILGYTVSNGQMVAGANPVQLPADSKPLYQYIGQVDWIILHGSIAIDPDQLPAGYFWSKNDADYSTALDSLNGSSIEGIENELEGSLKDGDGQGNKFMICINDIDNNNNKGLYSTSRVNISGNYNSVSLGADRSEKQNRLLKVVVQKRAATEPNQQVCQWHIFKMFESSATWNNPSTNFVMKNIALKGNGGRNESKGPQGLSMINSFSNTMTVENVVANGFYTNLSHDNYVSGVKYDNIMTLNNSKMFDTYNAMAFTWRGNVRINNSMLKDAGGPLFIMGDGNSRTAEDQKPTITLDAQSEVESYSSGTESWYTQLGEEVPALFAQMRVLSGALQQISGKAFFHERQVGVAGKDNYASVLSVMIPESDTALGSSKLEDNHLIKGIWTSPTDTVTMDDPVFLQLSKSNTIIIRSGKSYALVMPVSNETLNAAMGTTVTQVLLGAEMFAKVNNADFAASKGFSSVSDYQASPVFAQDVQTEMNRMATEWRTPGNTTDTLNIWFKADPSSIKSPYLCVVFGDFSAEA